MLQTLQDFRFPQDLIDILLVSFIFYRILLIIRGTRALRMVFGLAMLLLALVVAKELGLYTLDWMVTSFWSQIVLALIILFAVSEGALAIDEVVRATSAMAEERMGGILVMERDTELTDIVEVGTRLDALISKDALLAIFNPHSPIHDGAVILRQGRIASAGCFLPLALRVGDPSLGTRHRAAIGLTEETDAVALVVSEETGGIALSEGGRITRGLDGVGLRKALMGLFATAGGWSPEGPSWQPRWRGWLARRRGAR
jgi:diadenylate cyclase